MTTLQRHCVAVWQLISTTNNKRTPAMGFSIVFGFLICCRRSSSKSVRPSSKSVRDVGLLNRCAVGSRTSRPYSFIFISVSALYSVVLQCLSFCRCCHYRFYELCSRSLTRKKRSSLVKERTEMNIRLGVTQENMFMTGMLPQTIDDKTHLSLFFL